MIDLISLETEVARLRQINLDLQRRLERARRDALLYAASFCEDHACCGSGLIRVANGKEVDHAGSAYAAKLREIAR